MVSENATIGEVAGEPEGNARNTCAPTRAAEHRIRPGSERDLRTNTEFDIGIGLRHEEALEYGVAEAPGGAGAANPIGAEFRMTRALVHASDRYDAARDEVEAPVCWNRIDGLDLEIVGRLVVGGATCDRIVSHDRPHIGERILGVPKSLAFVVTSLR